MPVSIRLSRFGRKDLPFYRVVVVDSRKKRDGEFLETIGTYDGLKTKLVTFKPERFDAWVKLGAQPSDTAKKLYRLFKKEGIATTAPAVESKKEAVKPKTKGVEKKVASEKEIGKAVKESASKKEEVSAKPEDTASEKKVETKKAEEPKE